MEHAVVGLLMWLHGALSVHAQALEAPEQRRVKAVQACIAAVAEADAPADGDAIAPHPARGAGVWGTKGAATIVMAHMPLRPRT